jgi:hypothetical protein
MTKKMCPYDYYQDMEIKNMIGVMGYLYYRLPNKL